MNFHPVQLIVSGFYHKWKVTLLREYFQSFLQNLNNVSVIQSTVLLLCKTQLINLF